MALLATLLALRHSRALLKLPPYLSAICILVGVAWLLVLPLNEYSRKTYVSENALLPGQVHTYFTGSEHNIFRAYRHEVAGLAGHSVEDRNRALGDVFRNNNLKVATQNYAYQASGRNISGQNVYAVLHGPRADATEAIVLVAAWRNMDDEINHSGVALVLTLARYFRRWSLWSKDIIFLISADSTSGPQAWVDAYHDSHSPAHIEPLAIKSGALQGAIAIDYPAGPWGHRYDKLHVVYDGVNGQLPNLDLFNTAIQVASGQMGIGATLQRMWNHDDSYKSRLQTIFRGMLSQGLGHASGPHSAFIPYHIDAITLQTVGDGWHDEMGLGRTVESLFRSLNNLLEHLHQSFFFYLLLQTNRFVSIGTYLPSAMLIAVNFSISSIALWVASGRALDPAPNPAATTKPRTQTGNTTTIDEKKKPQPTTKEETPPPPGPPPTTTKITHLGATALIPTTHLQILERPLFTPLLFTLSSHALGLLPLSLFNNLPTALLSPAFHILLPLTSLLPLLTAFLLSKTFRPFTTQETGLIQCFSLLLLGMFLAALATLNFSLSFLVGILSTPLSFVHSTSIAASPPRSAASASSTSTSPSSQTKSGTQGNTNKIHAAVSTLILALLNPLVVVKLATLYWGVDVVSLLVQAAEGWHVTGLWTQVVVWLVWWPAWFSGGVVAAGGLVG